MKKILVLISLLSFVLLSGCSNEESNNTQHSKPQQTTSTQQGASAPKTSEPQPNEPSTQTDLPSLKEYLSHLNPLAKEVDVEFKAIMLFQEPNEDIRKHHWELDEQIKKYVITNAKKQAEYPHHVKLVSHVLTAHYYNISLWQEYQNGDQKKAEETKKLIEAELHEFQVLAEKIESGKIKD